jgi:hypothetical protein
LNFKVKQEVKFFTAFAPNSDELVRVASANFGIDRNLLEFFVEESDGFAPVNPGGGGGEEEGDRF